MNVFFNTRFSLIFAASLLSALLFLITPSFSQAQVSGDCGFTATLESGTDSEEVRCLQKYLNANGFVIAESGPGSVGKETSMFRDLTKEAVIKWQKSHNITPASGVFGEKSKAVYLLDLVTKLTNEQGGQSVVVTEVVSNSESTVSASLVENESETDSEGKSDAERQITSALAMILDTYDELDNVRDDDPDEAVDIEEDTRESLKELFDSIKTYFDGDYDESKNLAKSALDDATNSFEDAGGESAKSKAEDFLDDVEDFYEEIEELLADAEDEGEEVGDAPELLEEARGLLDDADNAFSEGVYKQAISDANDAEDLLKEAEDEIDLVSDRDAEKFVKEVWDQFDEAEDKLTEAETDGEDIDEAEELLDDAKRNLKKADTAIDEEDYTEANDLAEEAEELIEEALDEL